MPLIRTSIRLSFLVCLFLIGTVYAAPQLEVSEEIGITGEISSLMTSSGGDFIVAGTEDGNLYLINKNRDIVWEEKLPRAILSLGVSSNGEYIVVGDDSDIYLFDKKGDWLWGDYGKTIDDNVRDVEVSQQGEYIAVGSSNKHLYLFNRDEELWRKDVGSGVQGVGISPSGDRIAVGTTSGIVYLFDNNGDLIWEHDFEKFINDVAIMDQGVLVASRYVYYLTNGDVAWSYLPPSHEATKIEVKLDDKVISIGGGKDAYLLNNEGKELFRYNSDSNIVDVAIPNEGKMIVGSGKEIRLLVPEGTVTKTQEHDITSPLSGSSVSDVISITGAPDEPYNSLRVLIDDNYACSELPCNWDTSAAAEGKHTISLVVEDEKGNLKVDKIEVFIGESGLAGKAGNLLDDLQMDSESSFGLNMDSPLSLKRLSGAIGKLPRWLVFALIVLPAAAYINQRNGKTKRYRWKPKRRYMFLK